MVRVGCETQCEESLLLCIHGAFEITSFGSSRHKFDRNLFFFLSLIANLSSSSTFTFLYYTFLSICLYLRSLFLLTFCLLSQGITKTPNTAKLKQTHFATVKINHLLFFSLSFSSSLSLFLSVPHHPPTLI